MTIKLFINDPLLKRPSDPIVFDDGNGGLALATTLESVLRNKINEHNGIGIAAPQIGFHYQCLLVGSIFMVNPKIIFRSMEQDVMGEGCLSFPGLFVEVARAKKVSVSYQDAQGVQHTAQLDDINARCFLHEYEHLEGGVFFKNASRLKLGNAINRAKKLGYLYYYHDLVKFMK